METHLEEIPKEAELVYNGPSITTSQCWLRMRGSIAKGWKGTVKVTDLDYVFIVAMVTQMSEITQLSELCSFKR